MKKLLVTCALPYANGPIHIGHLVEYIQADIWVRYWRLLGRDVVFFCADDTHGTPIMLRAWSDGITPEALIERYGREHRRDFTSFGIEFDLYHSTHSEENLELSVAMYRALQANGHIHEREIEQAFCPKDEMFLPDRYIRGTCPNCRSVDQYGDSCEVCSRTYSPKELKDPVCARCGTPPEWRPSNHLFFRLADFTDLLRTWLGSGHIQDEVANKLQEWFTEGLHDWDISRDAPYFGFEIPDHPGKYFYVWLDAPVGYMATTLAWCRRNDADFDSYWRRADQSDVVHIIGKDITYFHALFWPATLMGSGFRTPTEIAVHGFLTVNGEKMSKSRGTFINAATYLEHLDPQYLRYYYATKLSAKVEDVDLNFEDFVLRVNNDLVNKFANIPSRTLAILHKHSNGRLGRLDTAGHALVQQLQRHRDNIGALYERREFGQVTRLLAEMAGNVNTFLQENPPWQIVKQDVDRASAVCTAAMNAFRIIATYLQPILPQWGEQVSRMLNLSALTWAGIEHVLEDCPLAVYDRLVDRVDPARTAALVNASRELVSTDGATASPVSSPTLDALVSCEIKALRVLAVENVADGASEGVRIRLEHLDGTLATAPMIATAESRAQLVGMRLLALTNLNSQDRLRVDSDVAILTGKVDGAIVPAVVQRRTDE